MSRAITVAQLALTYGVGEDDVDGWLEAGLPHFMLRGRVLLLDDEAFTWCARTLARLRIGPHAHELGDRAQRAINTQEVDELVWDVGTLRERSAISRPAARRWVEYLESLRRRIAADEQEDYRLRDDFDDRDAA